MTRAAKQVDFGDLNRHEGWCLLTAGHAVLKAALETDRPIELIAGPRGEPFDTFLDLARDDSVVGLLRQHETRLLAVPTARRAITLAAQVARSGSSAIALVPNGHLDAAVSEITRIINTLAVGGSLILLLDDAPLQYPPSCPRRTAARLDLPCVEPVNVSGLRDAVQHAIRLSRAGQRPTGIVVHRSVYYSAGMIEAHPNRVTEPAFALLAPEKRRTRISETGGLLRVARRLELNTIRALPSPGQREPVGFITVGPARQTITHIANTLELAGRIPVLHLGLVHPIDEAAVGRFLSRCERAIVLEPRPGMIEWAVLAAAEIMRHRGEDPARVWGRLLPPAPEHEPAYLEPEIDLHPSHLARKIIHLLHMIRPTLQVATRLTPDPPAVAAALPPRGVSIGPNAAVAELRRMVTDVDQWLREHAPLEERNIPPTALAIDGVNPPSSPRRPRRLVNTEVWDPEAFLEAGLDAIRQIAAAPDARPSIFIICNFETPLGHDLERMARSAVPAESADRARIEAANLNDLAALRERLREAALRDEMTIIIVHDGPPPQYDLHVLERELAEVDRYGFAPREVLTWPADRACVIRQPVDEPDADQPSPTTRQLATDVRFERVTRRKTTRFRMRLRPLLEEVQVLRSRPPAWRWRAAAAERLELPVPIHARAPRWRAHLAGFRGQGPGVAGWVLAEAGRHMGYHVALRYDPTPIGPGRRAWTQILFTRRPRSPDAAVPDATIPVGEADVLLGLDPIESLRAVDGRGVLRVCQSGRSGAVINIGAFEDQVDAPGHSPEHPGDLGVQHAVERVTRDERRLIADVAGACRRSFSTDRLTDVALVGAAWQMGEIPLRLDAIEPALQALEARGYGRSREAFEFGRRLAARGGTLDGSERSVPARRAEPLDRMLRRMVLSVGSAATFRGGRSRARSLRRLIERTLAAMPGLSESQAGRASQRDLVAALYRCVQWGGLDVAERYADLLTALYRSDRGDTGRAITRHAILPLAEAMLIRDPIYIASMTTSPEQRRHIRQRLNVRAARGDVIERRYLTRFEIEVHGRRFRADVRTSDWPARIARMARAIMPRQWRGTRRERDLRDYVVEFVRRAAQNCPVNYPPWAEAMRRLHHHAIENRLRGMALAEVRMLVEPIVGEPEPIPRRRAKRPAAQKQKKTTKREEPVERTIQ